MCTGGARLRAAGSVLSAPSARRRPGNCFRRWLQRRDVRVPRGRRRRNRSLRRRPGGDAAARCPPRRGRRVVRAGGSTISATPSAARILIGKASRSLVNRGRDGAPCHAGPAPAAAPEPSAGRGAERRRIGGGADGRWSAAAHGAAGEQRARGPRPEGEAGHWHRTISCRARCRWPATRGRSVVRRVRGLAMTSRRRAPFSAFGAAGRGGVDRPRRPPPARRAALSSLGGAAEIERAAAAAWAESGAHGFCASPCCAGPSGSAFSRASSSFAPAGRGSRRHRPRVSAGGRRSPSIWDDSQMSACRGPTPPPCFCARGHVGGEPCLGPHQPVDHDAQCIERRGGSAHG